MLPVPWRRQMDLACSNAPVRSGGGSATDRFGRPTRTPRAPSCKSRDHASADDALCEPDRMPTGLKDRDERVHDTTWSPEAPEHSSQEKWVGRDRRSWHGRAPETPIILAEMVAHVSRRLHVVPHGCEVGSATRSPSRIDGHGHQLGISSCYFRVMGLTPRNRRDLVSGGRQPPARVW